MERESLPGTISCVSRACLPCSLVYALGGGCHLAWPRVWPGGPGALQSCRVPWCSLGTWD